MLFPYTPSSTDHHQTRPGRPVVEFQKAQEIISPQRQGRLWDPPRFLLKGYQCFFLAGKGVKRPGRDVDLALWVKNEWSCTSTPPNDFMVWAGKTFKLFCFTGWLESIFRILLVPLHAVKGKGKAIPLQAWTALRVPGG
jgi:hypothetical protein